MKYEFPPEAFKELPDTLERTQALYFLENDRVAAAALQANIEKKLLIGAFTTETQIHNYIYGASILVTKFLAHMDDTHVDVRKSIKTARLEIVGEVDTQIATQKRLGLKPQERTETIACMRLGIQAMTEIMLSRDNA